MTVSSRVALARYSRRKKLIERNPRTEHALDTGMGERGGGRRNFCLVELNSLQAPVYTRFDVCDVGNPRTRSLWMTPNVSSIVILNLIAKLGPILS
jgi:hypothetical protein